MNFLSLKIDRAVFAQAERDLAGIKNGITRATVNAINATITATKKRMIKGLTDKLTLKSAYLKKRIYSNRFDARKGYSSITLYGRNMSLSRFKSVDTRFKGRTRGIGVIVEEVKGMPRTIPGAFKAEAKTRRKNAAGKRVLVGVGADQVFKRRGEDRLPIDALKSLKLFDLFKVTGVKEDVERFSSEELTRQFKNKVADQITKYANR